MTTTSPARIVLTIGYTNHRSEWSERHLIPQNVWLGMTAYHPERQWFMTALDVDKEETRDFALKNFGPNIARIADLEATVARLTAALGQARAFIAGTDDGDRFDALKNLDALASAPLPAKGENAGAYGTPTLWIAHGHEIAKIVRRKA